MLEVYTALVILGRFDGTHNEIRSEDEEDNDAKRNCEMIEHRVNLLLLLFTFRE